MQNYAHWKYAWRTMLLRKKEYMMWKIQKAVRRIGIRNIVRLHMLNIFQDISYMRRGVIWVLINICTSNEWICNLNSVAEREWRNAFYFIHTSFVVLMVNMISRMVLQASLFMWGERIIIFAFASSSLKWNRSCTLIIFTTFWIFVFFISTDRLPLQRSIWWWHFTKSLICHNSTCCFSKW